MVGRRRFDGGSGPARHRPAGIPQRGRRRPARVVRIAAAGERARAGRRRGNVGAAAPGPEAAGDRTGTAAEVPQGLSPQARQGQEALRAQAPAAPHASPAPALVRLAPMRALVQRVSQAAVDVEGERVAQIGPGMLVLLGVGVGDGAEEADRLAEKVRKLRIFDDEEGRMNEPLGGREVLCVSQFTLYGDARRGNRPSYVDAARPEVAEPLYDRFCARLGAKKGVFGACMGVALINDGPVTLMLEVPTSGR